MTIISQDQLAFSHSFPGGYARTWRVGPEFLVIGMLSLLGLSVSALVLMSSAAADLEALAPFLE
jgi:hypothetical protein